MASHKLSLSQRINQLFVVASFKGCSPRSKFSVNKVENTRFKLLMSGNFCVDFSQLSINLTI